jgi:hypothetical protein
MKKVSKTKLVVTDDSRAFETQINNAIAGGYQPYGKMIVVVGGRGLQYVQQLVLVEDEK